jgi:DNA ligase-1
MPSVAEIFKPGKINVTNFKKEMDCLEWVKERKPKTIGQKAFQSVYYFMQNKLKLADYVKPQHQVQLPFNTDKALEIVEGNLDNITDRGGEGLCLRKGSAYWIAERTYNLLKLKGYLDDEAIAIGCTSGRETDKGSKLLGMMGALIVKYNEVDFELSGFTDAERELNNSSFARQHPGEIMPDNVYPVKFPHGTKITFRYRELTNDGKPKEARYLRKKEDV